MVVIPATRVSPQCGHHNGGGESQLALSVHHTGHHTRALRGRRSENGSCVPIRALLLMAELVVVRSESATAVVARVRLFS